MNKYDFKSFSLMWRVHAQHCGIWRRYEECRCSKLCKPFNFQKAYKLKDEDVNKNHLTFQLIFNNTYHNDMSYYCTFSLQNLCWV